MMKGASMSEKKDYVASQFAKDIHCNMAQLSKSVREKFGKGLNLMHVRQLRDAYEAGSFDRKWAELFASEEELAKSKAGLEKARRKGKVRGERRRKMQLKGRRNLDRDKVLMQDLKSHLVVYRAHDGFMHSRSFKSRKRAEQMVKQLIGEGTPAGEIGYFKRNEIQTTVTL
jgi:hypothetical protein